MRQKRVMCLAVLLASVVGCSSSSTPVRQTADSAIEPEAQRVLHRMCDALTDAKSFRVRVCDRTDERLVTGRMAQVSSERTVTCRRPDHLYITGRDDGGRYRAWYDGKTLSVLSLDEDRFAVVDAPDTTEALFEMLLSEYDVNVPLAELFVAQPYAMLTAHVNNGMVVGRTAIDGTDCHHLAFRQDTIDWQLWVEAGPTALPRKVVIIYKQEPGNPRFTAMLDRWDLTPKVSDDLFAFVAPQQAQRVELAELTEMEDSP